jgi:heme A synthase
VPLALALAHQAMAIVVLTVAVAHAQRLAHRHVVDGREPAAVASSPRLDARSAAIEREGAT